MRYRKSASVALAPLALVLTSLAIAMVRPEIVRANELGWHILPNSPTASRHDDVQFLDPDLGWVVNSNGQVWRTTNGGESWELQLQISETLRGVHFLDESLGFVSTINAPPDSLLYRTTNGGVTWTNVTLPGQLPYGICGLMGVGDHIFASGAYTGSMTFGRRFLRSTDRGVTWTNFDLAPHLFNVIDCYFTSPDSGFVVGGRRDGTINHPVVLFTPDGGQTWETRYYSTAFDSGTYCWKIFFVNALVGYVSIQGQAVLKTTDGGLTWVRKPVPGASLIQGVGFASETLGWVDGVSPPLVTTDGGETWNPTYFTGNPNSPWSDVNRFQMLSPSLGYCAGRRIYKYESVTTAVPVALVTPATRLNLTSYPNPAVGEVVLRYVLNEDGPVRVRVYTLLGRYIRTLHEGWQPAGSKSVLWHGDDEDGRHLGRGIYFYRVDAEGTAETARLVLVK